MKRISKILSACIISVLLLGSMSVTAFAAETTFDQESLDNYVSTVMPQITSLTEDAAAETIAYYNENGYPGVAEGFQSWIDLKASVGEYQSVGTCTATQNEDGSMEITAPVTCTGGTIYITMTLDTDGYVSSFLFTGSSSASGSAMGAKLKEASVNLVVGMGTVFAVLIFLCWVISLFRHIGKFEKLLSDRKAGKSRTDSPAAENRAETVTVSSASENDDELQAVIAAAIAAYEADNGSAIDKQPALGNGITIKSYRRN